MTNHSKPKAHILIVEDDHSLNQQLSLLLTEAGYSISQAFDGNEGLMQAISQQFDLILLDVSLPGKDGYTVLKLIRQNRETPVMMLTAHGAEEERIIGLRIGADDYMSKPFNLMELLLRIEAIIRRSQPVLANDLEQQILHRQGLELNKQKQKVAFNGESVILTPLQFKLLWTLMRHPTQTLSKPELYRLVLERDYSRYDRSLDMHMSRVRRKLVEAGMAADRLQTVHGIGYVLL